ncbi:hypothetical protein PHSY_001319 [Pseudozyma hubeiensis SY62]|uniref:Uncharacterized protein n=1 Tax=Pseudozyma hubeiensis (strain SY62) TaxID=1305764 RepID=R9NYH6_PSEHS|nr:hypothetical protein PHSY_001319 [Pseudozyma hubeiensis SY62]GAC93754.1 hypothetical protein PHSY_001319 [Pseudozyma hubeiensis SY62]
MTQSISRVGIAVKPKAVFGNSPKMHRKPFGVATYLWQRPASTRLSPTFAGTISRREFGSTFQFRVAGSGVERKNVESVRYLVRQRC